MKRRKGDHVVSSCNGLVMQCLHCCQSYEFRMPIAVGVWVAMSKAFYRLHKDCVKKEDTDGKE